MKAAKVHNRTHEVARVFRPNIEALNRLKRKLEERKTEDALLTQWLEEIIDDDKNNEDVMEEPLAKRRRQKAQALHDHAGPPKSDEKAARESSL